MAPTNENLSLSENRKWIPKENNIGEFVLKYMKIHKNKTALIDADKDISLTYEQVLSHVISTAKEMLKHGLTNGDIISICSRNCLENTIPLLASFLIGVKTASLDPALSLRETTFLINLVKPKMIFCDTESLDLIEEALNTNKINIIIVVIGKNKSYLNFDLFLNNSIVVDEDFKIISNHKQDDTALILFSSGSTGVPKGVLLSHYALLYRTRLHSDMRPLNRNTNFASTYWISSILIILASIYKGAERIVFRHFTAKKLLESVEKYKIECISISPVISAAFTSNPELCSKYDHSSLKYASLCGSNFAEEHLHKFRKLFPTLLVLNLYGMTEACGVIVSFNYFKDKNMILKKGMSCGRPIPGNQIKVVDLETNKAVGPNQKGELRIKSNVLMKGYYKNNEEYENQFDEDGYFCTGDIVYYDKDYCFYVINRIKNMFKYKYFHINPISIESVLLTHPSIKEGIVLGFPTETDGEAPTALIVLKPNSHATSDNIIKYVEERVSDRERLRGGVIFLSDLIKTPTGKVRRWELRNMVINGILNN